MSLGWNRTNEDPLRCSFCRNDQDSVGKLISNAGDFSRVYICDGCVRICNSIIHDDNTPIAQTVTEMGQKVTAPHPLLTHPLASELMPAISEWIREESLGKDGLTELSKVRAIAHRLVQTAVTGNYQAQELQDHEMLKIDAVISDAVPAVNPGDLQRLWSFQSQSAKTYPGAKISFTRESIAKLCESKTSDPIAVWARAALIGILMQQGVLDNWREQDGLHEAVFRVAALFPLPNGLKGVDPTEFVNLLSSEPPLG
jgi:hypothetical protein